MRTVPRRPITTQRLTLEPAGLEHAARNWEAASSSLPELRPWMGWTADASRATTEAYLASVEREWAEGRGYVFVIVEPEEGRTAGGIGLTVGSPLDRSAELGYWVRTDRAGRGFATEAGRAVVDFGFDALGLHRIEVSAGLGNHASNRVILKLGFTFEGIRRHAAWNAVEPYDVRTYGLLRTDPRPGR